MTREPFSSSLTRKSRVCHLRTQTQLQCTKVSMHVHLCFTAGLQRFDAAQAACLTAAPSR